MSEAATQITGIGTVIVPVADQDRALDFYVGTLGFEKRTDAPFGNDYRWIEVAPTPDSPTTIALAPPPPGNESGNPETGIALNTTDIDADRAQLKGRGVQPVWTTSRTFPSGSRSQNIGGTGPPIRLTSSS